MLSIENNAEVPSSFKLPAAVKTDEKVHQLGGGTQNNNFCIRNYVSESRNKDIGLTWPFPQHCLQLCLNQGINDVLPHFEPPGLVRAKCSKKTIIEVVSVIENSVDVSRAASEEPTELQRKLEVSEEKSKLVVKLSSISVITRTEDLTSNCSEVSDTMASKVCPVCRIFVSTSNTTLNAHIDQCLSSETDTKSFVNSSSNIKVKPRKKRLMVDIYASAPHCTIEDLDKRNGRNWAAADLTVSTPNSEVNKEAKRPKLGPVDTGADENDGAVYVDSNGIKLRILSKFSDATVLMPNEDLKLSKHTEDFKNGSNSLVNMKKQFGSITTKSQGKKLNSLKLSDSKIQEAPQRECEEEHYQEKEESLLQKLNSQDKAKGDSLSSIIPRVCSKRSDLQRKINNKDIHGNVENIRTRTPVVGTNQPRFVDPLAIQSHTKFTRPSDTLSLAPKISTDILSNTVNITGNVKMNPATHAVTKSILSLKSGKPASGLMLKVSKSKGIISSSPKSEKEKVCKNSSPMSDNIPDMAARAFRKCSTLNASNLVRRRQLSDGLGKKHSIFKNLRKHRSVAGAGKKCPKLRSDSGTFSSPAKNAETVTNSEGGEEITMADKGKSNILKMKIKASTFTKHMVTDSAEEVIPDQVCRIASTNECTPASTAELAKAQTSAEEHAHLPTSPSEQERPCRDRACDEVASANDQVADEVRTRAEEHSCQDSSACLSNQEDMEIEIPQENSSITSNRKMSSNTDNSIVSTASTISPSSSNGPNGSKLEESLKLQLSSMPSIEVAEVTNTDKVKAAALAKELVQVPSPDAQVCCCSRRDYPPREPQFSKMHINSGKQMVSNLQIRPISPSFSHCSAFQADMESPTASMCTMASSDSAAKLPTIHDFSSPSPTQSTTKPVLRLMGKNLTVECKEETHTPLPSPMSDTATLKHSSNHGYSNHHPYLQQQQQHHFMGVPLVFSQASSIASNQLPLHSYGMPMRDFIVIDDSTDHERVQRATNISSATIPASNLLQHRPFFPYFQQHSQLIPMEFHGGFRPYFDNTRAVQQSGAPGDSAPPLPQSASRFPSPLISHLHPSLFYPETMR